MSQDVPVAQSPHLGCLRPGQHGTVSGAHCPWVTCRRLVEFVSASRRGLWHWCHDDEINPLERRLLAATRPDVSRDWRLALAAHPARRHERPGLDRGFRHRTDQEPAVTTRFALPNAIRAWACLLERDGQRCWEQSSRGNRPHHTTTTTTTTTGTMNMTTGRPQDPCHADPHHAFPT